MSIHAEGRCRQRQRLVEPEPVESPIPDIILHKHGDARYANNEKTVRFSAIDLPRDIIVWILNKFCGPRVP